ncbi:translation initiation factor IF-2 [Eggerthellaceae bacterium zg-887]|uniref:translation initiation factor IF-2 n=1 Tax=Xiamenia xianingshaonis TaxID=2682776 RepID=UPI00140B718D|nr:translation initiation factor IF-2 [Xiamenia xianingshaonis]NHM16103.1 translation initiation factor IF-2 [Xiamenia xianingshaonis]
MAGMRVHELAKEFNMSSKEMLDKLHEMKVPAKSHASMLNDAHVEKVRKNLAPEIKQRAGKLESEEAHKLAQDQAEAKAKKEEEERARREAVEQERAAREAERARRAEQDGEDGKPASKPKKLAPHASPYESLATQIENEKERVAREKAEAKARARAAAIAKEVAKKQAVEEALRNRGKTTKAPVPAKAPKKAAPVLTPRKSGFDSLLAQIDAEKQRMDRQKQAKPAPAQQQQQPGGRRGGKSERGGKKGKRGVQIVPELEAQMAVETQDRYAHMAVQAEKFQRDKVLAEARAAVEAATSHENEGRRKKRKQKREAEQRERLELEAIEKGLDPTLVLDDSVVEIPQGATVAKFAELLGVAPNDVIKRLFMLGQVLTLTQSMSDDLVELIADDMGRKVRVVSPEEEYAVVYHDSEADLLPRPPVVTVMGHVDHGKTSLLDAIRHTGVVESEAGGITQHIGASVVEIDGRRITFIDTPGHEAFTAMRARGAQVTDVIVLVVAADDGVMPQTIEAINHAKAADVPIVVAVNKIDKPGANPDRVRQELTEYGVIPEEWGGKNMFVEVSAKKKLHIDDLLETILLQADVLELKANPNADASGFVIEANLDKGRGPVATVLIQRGTLKTGDVVVAGTSYGRVRALVDPRGTHVADAKPADPVEILGLSSVPTAGDEFRVFADERDARKLADERQLRERLAAQDAKAHMSLDDLFSRIEEGKQTDLNLIVKADVQGSIEALRDAFEKMDQSEVRINIVHSAVGGITETDVTLAAASDAIIIGFNVRPTGKSRTQAEKEKVDIRLYRVIYQAIEDINAARVGLLSPDIVEEDTGIAEVRDTFRVPKVGTIAGCYVVEGEISRDDKVRIVRDGTVIFDGVIASLRRFKDDVKTVKQGYECGIGIEKFQDLKVGDFIEGYKMLEVERTE